LRGISASNKPRLLRESLKTGYSLDADLQPLTRPSRGISDYRIRIVGCILRDAQQASIPTVAYCNQGVSAQA